jgi:hypothetical protein
VKLSFYLIIIIVSCLSASWIQDNKITDDFIIKYSAGTRGYSCSLEINKDSTYFNEENYIQNKILKKTVETDKEELNQIIKEINQISLDTNYPAPSFSASYDADLSTELVIIKNGNIFRAGYDYSNPNISLNNIDRLLKNQIDLIKK